LAEEAEEFDFSAFAAASRKNSAETWATFKGVYCDLGPVPRRSPAPTAGAPDMLHRVQAYRGHLVQQPGFITASTTLLPPLSDRMRRRVEAATEVQWFCQCFGSVLLVAVRPGRESFSDYWWMPHEGLQYSWRG
ncbi:hypothetical protein ElyMa_004414000, partial [Elysia marginata]